ncbi:MAG: TonB-dependent receptor [Patescibacteria group bacterium]
MLSIEVFGVNVDNVLLARYAYFVHKEDTMLINNSSRSLIVLVFLISLLFAVPVGAQERVGAIRGTVYDSTRGVIPGAVVSVSGPGLIKLLSVATDVGGGYLLQSIPPGVYSVMFSANSFAPVLKDNVVVRVGRTTSVDVELKVADIQTVIEVSEAPPFLDTATNVISANIDSEKYEKLPTGLGFASLAPLAPGVNLESKQGGLQIDGASGSENSFVLDGVEVGDIRTGVLGYSSNVPFEWIQEMQVKSGGVDAEFGGAIGGVVSAVTKSGGNNFHGQASLYSRFDGLNSGPNPSLRLNPYDDEVAEYFHNKRDGYRFLNPGYALGGPIRKDRVWFFSSYFYQGARISRSVVFLDDNEKRDFVSRQRQDFALNKVDFAPLDQLRGSFSYYYKPLKTIGILPSQQGTDSPDSHFGEKGYRSPNTSYQWQLDYTFGSSLLFRGFGGYNYSNFKDYGTQRGTFYSFATSNLNLPASLPVPENFRYAAGNITDNNNQTVQDIYGRHNVNLVSSYFTERLGFLPGQHNLKVGYDMNRLHNAPVANTWPDGAIFVVWDRARRGITRPGTFRGKYGYYVNRVFGTSGDVSSSNQGLFLQDSWQVKWGFAQKLTLNLGIRTEREFVPSFRTDNGIASKAIKFGFADKISPRLGFALDPTGSGNATVRFSYSVYHDVMKYELPRGSFGGDMWKDYVYTLEDPNFWNIKPNSAPNSGFGNFPGFLIEVVDWRIPSNDPENNLIDPGLKPVRLHAFDLSAEKIYKTNWVYGVRFVHKVLDRTVEDVGTLTDHGEEYRITNPGFSDNVTPRAKRNYDALEIKLEKRKGSNLVLTSYTLSRLYGNYGGLASADERGRTSPNVNRYFDLPWMNYDSRGELVYGRLATDRPHTFKFFSSYDLKSRLGTTQFSPALTLMSGTPLSTEADVISSTPVFLNGRGDMGRTPVFSNTDMKISHEFKVGRSDERKMRLEATMGNLFNQRIVVDKISNYIHPHDGQIQFENFDDALKGYDYESLRREQDLRIDPRYGMPSSFSSPRSIRLGLHYIF